ncbi:MAG: glycoside hydrolase family 3 protein [Spirochaetales bacterium]|nr:glycoside hydrolase family 3 protein [Candidatus Physcosoma equi]
MKDYSRHEEYRVFSSQFMAVKKPAFNEKTCLGPYLPKEGLKAEEILKAMTLEEKIDYLSGINNFCTKPLERLGVPAAVSADATSGIRNIDIDGTMLPCGEAMAATFNRSLVRKAASVVARDGRRAGVSILLGPGVNMVRIPTGGRNFEYMGEDPYLAGEMAASYIQGVNDEKVITTVKHLACNNSDYNRNRDNAVVSERALREIYLPAFKKAIEKGGSLGVMTSYNLINGEHGSENKHLIEDILRTEWGFDGLVMSDWISLYSAEAVMHHGVDLEMPFNQYLNQESVGRLLKEGKITEEEIDRKVLHTLSALERSGVFQRPVNDTSIQKTERDSETAYQVATEGIILLKNESSLLPLAPKTTRNIVILGANAERLPYSGGGSCFIMTDVHQKTIPEVLEEKLEDAIITVSSSSRWYEDEALMKAVKEADVVLYETGFDELIESEFYDKSYELPNDDAEGIRKAAELSDKVVVVVTSGGDWEKKSWIEKVPAVIDGLFLGERAAEAQVDVLFGFRNPSGKLPFTLAHEMMDYPTVSHYPEDYDRIDDYRQGMKIEEDPSQNPVFDNPYDEGIFIGYRYFDSEKKDVAFPFGHGLSYTTFSYSGLEVEKNQDGVSVSFLLKNTGKMDGKETSLVFIHDTESSIKAYQELKGFEKTELKEGEEKKVSIQIPYEEFGRYDEEQGCWVVDKHTYTIRVGASSRDIRLEENVSLN